MSEFKGTKGKLSIVDMPYKFEGEYQGIFKIANEKGKFFGSTDCYSFRKQSFQEMHANAQLIAYAPQMLDMLKEIVKWSKTKDGRFTFTTSAEKGEEIKQLIQHATTI